MCSRQWVHYPKFIKRCVNGQLLEITEVHTTLDMMTTSIFTVSCHRKTNRLYNLNFEAVKLLHTNSINTHINKVPYLIEHT